MGSDRKAEVNLALGSGFLRIASDDIVYNISFLGSGSGEAAGPPMPAPPVTMPAQTAYPTGGGETGELQDTQGHYYKQVSTDIFQEIGQLAKHLSSTLSDLPAEDRKIKRVELDEAGEKIEDAKSQLRDIVSMTERATMEIMDHVERVQKQTGDVLGILASMRQARPAVGAPEAETEGAASAVAPRGGGAGTVETLRDKLARVLELVRNQKPAPAEAVSAAPPSVRFRFSVKTILQTLYEFCTNETVKSHINMARENDGAFFDQERFDALINEKVAALEPDADNFLNVPLSDVLQTMNAACLEKKIQNLLQKMDVNRQDIFLDMVLPLEVTVVAPSDLVAAENAGTAAPEAGAAEDAIAVEGLLAECVRLVEELPAAAGDANMAEASAAEALLKLYDDIESAFSLVTRTHDDITRITEVLSFQDLSGQQILKIIKLLSDFQVQLLAIVVSFGSRLKSKEKDASITLEESRKLAQNDVDRYLKSLAAEAETPGEPFDQDSVNRLLGELGF